MFSSDKNIETIAELVEALKNYIGLQKNLLQLNALEKTIKILTTLAVALILSLLCLLVVIFLSITAGFALTYILSPTAAFLSITVFYIILLVVFYANRKSWIERPLVRVLSQILID